MASLALPARPGVGSVLTELRKRHRLLASYGLALLLLAAIAVALQAIDPRTLASGVNVWVKPAKFLSSIGIFAVTAAWFFGYVRPERRRAWPARLASGMLLIAGTFELVWIVWQGANGRESHFNFDTPLEATMFQLMGVFAIILLGSTLPLAWEIARRPAKGLPGEFVAAVVIGLLLAFLMGGGFGAVIAYSGGHAIGPQAGHAPLFGWNRTGGDLRIAHFLGIHAEQAIPILGALVAGASRRLRWPLLIGGTGLYVLVAMAVFEQAMAGRPLLPL